jgi:hypothetical protein
VLSRIGTGTDGEAPKDAGSAPPPSIDDCHCRALGFGPSRASGVVAAGVLALGFLVRRLRRRAE